MSGATLFGWHATDACLTGATIEVVGVPSDAGNCIASGARLAPAAIRLASQAFAPSAQGRDHGDLVELLDRDWHEVLRGVEARMRDIVERGSCPILLGGDHAISWAGVAAARGSRPLNILWFDAHTDFCAWPNQSWHNHKQVLRRIASMDHVGRILQVGHRGITYFDETTQFDRVSVVTASEAQQADPATLIDQLPPDEPVYLSIDIDAIDPCWAPGTGHPVPGGLSVAGLGRIARAIAAAREVVAVDMMEVNPALDDRARTSTAAAAILADIVPMLRPGQQPAAGARPAMEATA